MKKELDWLVQESKNILKEIKLNEAQIEFKVNTSEFGSKKGRLIIRNNNSIIVIKDYLSTPLLENVQLIYKDKKFSQNT